MRLSFKIAVVCIIGMGAVLLVERIFGSLAISVVVAAVCVALAIGAGHFLVGKPVRILTDKARQIGDGSFSPRLELRQHDELTQLSSEMNAMSARLAEAHDRLAAETSRRIAAVEALRHADRLMTVGQLAAGVAHEIGTPLNVVSGRAKMIVRRSLAEEEVVDSARIIVEQAERIDGIIRHLLNFARRRTPRKAAEDLRRVVERPLELLRPMAAKKGLTLALTVPGEDAIEAEVDSAQIEQVLTNLIVNGIQAMFQGGAITVSMGRRRAQPPPDHAGVEGLYTFIDVRDEGPGVPAEAMKHLFEPFFTTKNVGEGTGLGLPVSYGIVREHGGWIGVQSEAGKGSCFTIYLP